MTFENVLRAYFEREKIAYTNENLENCKIYKELIKEWNEKINLTALTDDEVMAEKHFYDSIAMMKYIDLKNKSLIDVGTGAGFPGLPLKIMIPSLKLTLLDSLNKRIDFLKIVGESVGIEDVKYLHGRAEDYATPDRLRESFDYATSRAVARLNILCEYCLPYVKVGGYFIALKGKDFEEEVTEAEKAVEILGGKFVEVLSYDLEKDESTHYLVIIKKIKETPLKYPRKAGKPSKKPII